LTKNAVSLCNFHCAFIIEVIIGELNASHINTEVTLAGWVQNLETRIHEWVDLRDRYGITQLIFDEGRSDKTVLN
jgi:aspartyl-tRNA synthetase